VAAIARAQVLRLGRSSEYRPVLLSVPKGALYDTRFPFGPMKYRALLCET
jgi:hypothetical protein